MIFKDLKIPLLVFFFFGGKRTSSEASSCSLALHTEGGVPSVTTETSSCTDASATSVVSGGGALLTCPSACWTSWVTARDIVADRACMSTIIRFCGGGVVMDSAVSSVSSEALGLLDFDRVKGAERFLGGIT